MLHRSDKASKFGIFVVECTFNVELVILFCSFTFILLLPLYDNGGYVVPIKPTL